jgi:hypothetical protein
MWMEAAETLKLGGISYIAKYVARLSIQILASLPSKEGKFILGSQWFLASFLSTIGWAVSDPLGREWGCITWVGHWLESGGCGGWCCRPATGGGILGPITPVSACDGVSPFESVFRDLATITCSYWTNEIDCIARSTFIWTCPNSALYDTTYFSREAIFSIRAEMASTSAFSDSAIFSTR